MRNIPVDTSRFKVIVTAVDSKMDPTTKMQRANSDGEPAWTIQVLTTSSEDDASTRAELTDLTVHGAKPEISPMTEIECDNLVGRLWEMNGRSGMSFSATAIRPVASTNNRRPAPAAPPVNS